MANLQAATVAYWRFEAGPANTDVVHTGNAAMFTSGPSGVATGPDLRTITPAQWTVEVSYKAEANAGYRTVLHELFRAPGIWIARHAGKRWSSSLRTGNRK